MINSKVLNKLQYSYVTSNYVEGNYHMPTLGEGDIVILISAYIELLCEEEIIDKGVFESVKEFTFNPDNNAPKTTIPIKKDK